MMQPLCTAILSAATEKLVELGKLRPGHTVLDLACGEGPVAWLAALQVRPGGRVVGLDQSEAVLETAKRLAESEGMTEIELRVGRAEALDFPDATFDAVFCQLGLELCESPAHVLAEIARVLKPGGRVALMTLGARDRNEFLKLPYEALRAAQRPVAPLDRYFQISNAETLESLLKSAGLVESRCQNIGLRLEVSNHESLWQLAASIAGWPAGEYEFARDSLARALRDKAGGASVSMEVLLALAIKPVDPREAVRPRSFDDLVTAARLRVRELTPFEARRTAKAKGTVFLDIREQEELGTGVLPNSVRVPRGLLEMLAPVRLPDPQTNIIVYGDDGRRSALAAQRLQELGYQNVWNLQGGFRAWLNNAYPVDRPA